MSDALLLAMCALFAFRVWRFLAVDTFPPMKAAREWFDGKLGTEHWAVELLDCPWCSGSWVAFATVGAVWAVKPLPLPALWFGATAALVGLVAKYEQAP